MVADSDTDAGAVLVAKHAVGEILEGEVRGGIVGGDNPASHSHPSASRSRIGSVNEQEPKLIRNFLRASEI